MSSSTTSKSFCEKTVFGYEGLDPLFHELMNELRVTMAPKSYIILFGETLVVNIDGNTRNYNLNLDYYHLLKSIAHYLVYYSFKHGKCYDKLEDLCPKLRPAPYADVFPYSISMLMEMATEWYLTELHKGVQLLRKGEWPAEMLCLVCGPASPRFGHPGMQYFARLANKRLEQRTTSCQGKNICYEPSDGEKYPGRTLFYIENAHSWEEALSIGTTLLVEQKVMSQFADMSMDILAPNAMQHLQSACGK